LANDELMGSNYLCGWRALRAATNTNLRRLWQSPLLMIYVLAVVLRLTGLLWGLPSTDGWDDDAVAPRDFLPGLVQTFTPGEYYTYPPVHLILLAIVSAPIWLFKLATAPSLAPSALVSSFLTARTMTAFSFCARALAIVFACVTIHAITSLAALMVTETARTRVRQWAGFLLLGNATLTYYGQVGNLDGPYLAWASLALLELARVVAWQRSNRLYRFAVYAALATGTKDQAYAIFLLSVPLVWLLALPRLAQQDGYAASLRTLLQTTALAAALLLLVDGAAINPNGFANRVRFLLGSASQDHAYYTKDMAGRIRLLEDLFTVRPSNYYPAPAWLLLPAGLALSLAARRARSAHLAIRLLPLLAAGSFTLAFNFAARRTEHRFLLPQAVLCAPYMGIALARLAAWRSSGRKFSATLILFGLVGSIGVDVAMLNDPRYAVEAWLRTLPTGSRVETYGNNVYLPRIPAHILVQRAGDEPLARRGIVTQFHEVEAPPAAAMSRGAEVLVISEMWTERFYGEGWPMSPGYMTTAWQHANAQTRNTRAFLDALRANQTEYELVLDAHYVDGWFPITSIHASIARTIYVYRRRPQSTPAPTP
jgi:hypothetical protein